VVVQDYLNPDATISEFGASVAGVGDRVAVGAPDSTAGPGKVFIFDKASGVLSDSILNPEPTLGMFGAALASVGESLLVGAPAANVGPGIVHLYTPCGDGKVDPGEGCDDGNMTPGDCCSASCGVEAPPCGGGTTSTTTTTTTTSTTTTTFLLNAPALRQDVATDIRSELEFLYAGPNAVQTGVAPGAIKRVRASGVTGAVKTRTGSLLPGVRVSVFGHLELGETLTRANGQFDLAVNGGGVLTLRYEKPGYATADRHVTVGWQGFAVAEDVVLVPFDDQPDTIDLSLGVPIQRAEGPVVTDADGTRQPIVLFKQGTTAALMFADATTQPIATLNVRATEYTVGATGQQAMPAPLPPLSGYTYAIELDAVEVAASGATGIAFSQPVVFLVDNFLEFDVGSAVPLGYYDRTRAEWVAEPDGRIIKIVGIDGSGLAEIDISGDGVADDAGSLGTLGIDSTERAELADLYASQLGKELWRVTMTHFTPWDCNWPYAPPGGAENPDMPPPTDNGSTDPQSLACGSIIGCESQTLGESIPVTGTPFSLVYRSDGMDARKPSLRIPLTDDAPPTTTPPAFFTRVEVEVSIAGRVYRAEYPPEPNIVHVFEWEGIDRYGRVVQGSRDYTVTITYVYRPVPINSSGGGGGGFGSAGDGTIIGDRARFEIRMSQTHQGRLANWRLRRLRDLGGWNLDVHHAYDVSGQMLLVGTGERRSAKAIQVPDVIATVAGGGQSTNQNVPATDAMMTFPNHLAAAPDGSYYVVEASSRVRRVDGETKQINTVAGGGSNTGFDIPATQARLLTMKSVARGLDGSLYIAHDRRVVWVDPAGILRGFANNGNLSGDDGDGGPATNARLSNPTDVAVGPDGSVYIVDSSARRVRRVATNGIITTVAGNGGVGGGNVSGTATQVAITPQRVAVAQDGSFYIIGFQGAIHRVSPTGMLTTVRPSNGSGPDGDPLSEIAALPNSLRAGVNNSLLFGDVQGMGSAVRLSDPQGFVRTVAGSLTIRGFAGDGGPAAAANLNQPQDVAMTPDGRILVADTTNNRVREIGPALPRLQETASEINIPSEDGDEVYVFDADGRHLRTRDARTGAARWTFAYDAAGRLATVADVAGKTTIVERNASGVLTGIVAPGTQRTALVIGPDGYLASATNPANERHEFTYFAGGLIATHTDPALHVARYEYDDIGRLERAEDATTVAKTLDRTDDAIARSFRVSLTTAESRVKHYDLANLSTGAFQWTTTGFDGLATVLRRTLNASEELTTPEGMVVTTRWGSWNRFAMLAPVPKQITIATPAGPEQLIFTRMEERDTPLVNPSDFFSFATETRTVSVNGRVTTEVYDAATRTKTETSPEGRHLITTYDALGRVQQRELVGLAPVAFGYDGFGRVHTITQADGTTTRTVTLDYDTKHRLQTLTRAVGPGVDRVTTFVYDDADRVEVTHLPADVGETPATIGFRYTADGYVAGITPPEKPEHGFEYTPVHLEGLYQPPAIPGVLNPSTESIYNGDRQIEAILRPDGKTVSLTYDPVTARLDNVASTFGGVTLTSTGYSYTPTGLPQTLTTADQGTLTYGYNGSLLRSLTWGPGVPGRVHGTVSLGYDNSFRLQSVSVNGAAVGLTYDDDDSVTSAGDLVVTPDEGTGLISTTTLGVVTDERMYNDFGEISSYTAVVGGTPVLSIGYPGRDGLGRILTKTETLAGQTDTFEYAYDVRDRLETVTKNGALLRRYTYDANGNRLTRETEPAGPIEDGEYDDQDRLETYDGTTYTYGANGELETKTTAVGVTAYDYDALGNVRATTLPDNTLIEYVIDGENRRIGRKRNGVLEQGFLWQDALRVAAEVDGSGNVTKRFIYATGVNVADYMIRYDQGPTARTYRLVTDHLGSPRLVIDTATGAIVQRMDYDEFGRVSLDTNPGFQPFGFAGGLYDSDTGLVRLGARDYDARTARWTVKDPIKFMGGTSNLYAYALNDPINRRDPGGLMFEHIFSSPAERAGHSAQAVTVPQFLASMDGQTIGQLQNPTGDLVSDRSAQGPEVRYVVDPADPNQVIDMRHFLVVGPQGELAGLGIEMLQLLGDRGSAFDAQDFFSNALGSQFFRYYDARSRRSLKRQLRDFFARRANRCE
jgi:RHS repeat-associated protein